MTNHKRSCLCLKRQPLASGANDKSGLQPSGGHVVADAQLQANSKADHKDGDGAADALDVCHVASLGKVTESDDEAEVSPL